jgi:hypothetical protein
MMLIVLHGREGGGRGLLAKPLPPQKLCSKSHLEARCPLKAHSELDGKPAALLVCELAAFPVEGCDSSGEAAVA